MYHLTVVQPFSKDRTQGYRIGEEITDPETVTKILNGPNRHHVVKRMAPPVVETKPENRSEYQPENQSENQSEYRVEDQVVEEHDSSLHNV